MLNIQLTDELIKQIIGKAGAISLIVIIGEIGKRLFKIIIKKLKFAPVRLGRISTKRQQQRVNTLTNLLINTSYIVINFVVLVMILSELDIDIAPLLAGAGILGLAVGFGARSLVADIIAGFFIIFENQFNVGDEIEIAGHKGRVVKITLRTITLKDENKNRYIVPNSNIKTVTRFKPKASK
jgi:moderate conductance mechanosensitive channel